MARPEPRPVEVGFWIVSLVDGNGYTRSMVLEDRTIDSAVEYEPKARWGWGPCLKAAAWATQHRAEYERQVYAAHRGSYIEQIDEAWMVAAKLNADAHPDGMGPDPREP